MIKLIFKAVEDVHIDSKKLGPVIMFLKNWATDVTVTNGPEF